MGPYGVLVHVFSAWACDFISLLSADEFSFSDLVAFFQNHNIICAEIAEPHVYCRLLFIFSFPLFALTSYSPFMANMVLSLMT
jgi:hypothetical protein